MNVNVYNEPGMASVNSYLVEVGDVMFIIDGQRSLSSARKLLFQIQQTQKPVSGIFLTHPHPDHMGGLSVLAKTYPQAPIYALPQTHDIIQTDAQGYIKLSKQVLGDDFDENVPTPTHVVQSGEEISIGGTRFQVEDAGLGESSCMMMLYSPENDVLFCADIIQRGMTAFLLEGHLEAWLKQLDAVSAKYGKVKTVYPGHGASGDAQILFTYQRNYLLVFRQLVAAQTNGGIISPEGKQRIVAQMNHRYPGFLPVAEIPDLLEQNIDAVLKEMELAS